MYVRRINIDLSKCDAGACGHECVKDGQGINVFAIDSTTNKAQVKIKPKGDTQDIDDPHLEEEAGKAIGACPKFAIWGRGEGESIGDIH